jgi:hypothetical protein
MMHALGSGWRGGMAQAFDGQAVVGQIDADRIYFRLITSSRKGGNLMGRKRVCLGLFERHGRAIGADERG